MCKIVHYMKSPNIAKEKAHTAPLYACTEQDAKSFRSTEDAITFWLECSKPLSSLEDIMHTEKRTQKKRLEDVPLINLSEVIIKK